MVCEHCGTPREAIDHFCRWCGLPLPAVDSGASPTEVRALVPLAARALAPRRPAEAVKGAAALAVSLGVAALRYEPTRQLLVRGLTAWLEGRNPKQTPAPQPVTVQVIEVHQTVVQSVTHIHVHPSGDGLAAGRPRLPGK